ncbi:hypothetical protein EIN_273460 [Entamoeba invadens IP1]|uniref:small monomeric GTPase n=1 Tax=Entamoeba invadens IP1 TaxID=370355 RepID=A0A0A1U193_ENTIV|nr:hypothetical protein EIN_273460 [Entamoeba invadens IP1]ELP87819.1 hypothetical protein EIN_273460 [Entamoeba invadens IP1]|eukprot:XP_004254590.1 hypothetical protein EIN_273460 [Entamoeba invadens IP1]
MSLQREPDKQFRVGVIGDDGVGKSSFILSSKYGIFESNFGSADTTCVFNFEVRTQKFSLNAYEVDCSDTYAELRTLSYRDVDCFVVLFSYDSKESLIHAERKWLKEIKASLTDPLVIFVMTKQDLAQEKISEEKKIVTEEYLEAIRVKPEFRFMFQCSSKSPESSKEVWTKIAETIFEQKKPKRKRKLSTTEKIKSFFM